MKDEKNRLKFRLELKNHPYPNHPSTVNDVWGSITILAVNHEETVLYYWEWDLGGFKEWYISNREAIRLEILAIGDFAPTKNETIAQALKRISNEIVNGTLKETKKELLLEQLFHYRERHGLRFGFRGAAMASIYIGLNKGIGEISSISADTEWSYTFDMENFCIDLDKRIKIIS